MTSSLSDTDLNAAAKAATGKDVALVFITGELCSKLVCVSYDLKAM